jgi:hypothetical protein
MFFLVHLVTFQFFCDLRAAEVSRLPELLNEETRYMKRTSIDTSKKIGEVMLVQCYILCRCRRGGKRWEFSSLAVARLVGCWAERLGDCSELDLPRRLCLMSQLIETRWKGNVCHDHWHARYSLSTFCCLSLHVRPFS